MSNKYNRASTQTHRQERTNTATQGGCGGVGGASDDTVNMATMRAELLAVYTARHDRKLRLYGTRSTRRYLPHTTTAFKHRVLFKSNISG